MSGRVTWRTVRRIWILWGIVVTIVFNVWMLTSSRAKGFDRRLLESDARVSIREEGPYLVFTPAAGPKAAGLLFFPGGGVDPKAYSPLARAVAEHGHEAVIVRLPYRLAPLSSHQAEAVERGRVWIEQHRSGRTWVAAGHSKGAVLACRLAAGHRDRLGGLVLIGTTHPVELDLSGLTFPVAKVYGTRDGVAPVAKVDAHRGNLPPGTRWVRIEGGNHGQFGWYGRQLGDDPATISREEQQALTLAALLDVLGRAEERSTRLAR